jgi:diguanylate cyclase (GGDEF)-like protein
VDEPADSRSRLKTLFGRRDDPYAGADIVLARKFGVGLWVFATLAVAALEVFYPPTRAFGNAGWAVTAVAYLVSFAIVRVLADKRRKAGFDFVFGTQFVGLLLVAVVQYGAGGDIAPYHELFMLQLGAAALTHPPRRVLVFLAAVAVAMFAPLVYAPRTADLGEIATELFMWAGLSLVLVALMRTIRAQRLALRQEGDEARQLARVDALTGLGNRRAFDEAIDAELARSRRGGTPLSLLVADLNGFKEINDRHGHVHGDKLLRQAAIALRSTVRRPDLCFRWGGDEFTILLSDADAEGAETLAIRVEKTVARLCSKPGGGSLTLTCGHATLDADMSAGEALSQADHALRALKSRGRVSFQRQPARTPSPAGTTR